jgi:hypothetical protein
MENAPDPDAWARIRGCALRAGAAILEGFARMGDAYYAPGVSSVDELQRRYDTDAQMNRFITDVNRT